MRRLAVLVLLLTAHFSLAAAAEPNSLAPAPLPEPAPHIADTADRERAVAEWALAHGGLVRVLAAGKLTAAIKNPVDLPADSFTINELELRIMVLWPADLAVVAELKTLWRLVLSDCTLGTASVEQLARSSTLRNLHIRQSTISDASIRPLALMKKIDTLSLENCAIGEAGLETIVQLAALKSLNLSGTFVSDDSLKTLARLPKLATLFLRNTHLGAKGTAHLAQLKALRTLSLTGASIDDAALAPLAAMSKLKTLEIERTRVAKPAVESLGKKLPNCKVVWKPADPALKPLAASKPLPLAVKAPTGLSVAGTRGFVPVSIESYCKAPLPRFLSGATILAPRALQSYANASQGRISLEIQEDADVFLAVFWDNVGNNQGEWTKDRVSKSKLRKADWVLVGYVLCNDPAQGWHFLYWRPCKKGELLSLRTRKTMPPLVIVPTSFKFNPLADDADPALLPWVAAETMSNYVGNLLRNQRFDELEQMIARIRIEKRHFRNGGSYLKTFYTALTPLGGTQETYERQLATYEAWIEAKPESVAALIAQSRYWINFAWQARGGGWARTVKPESWEKFGERLAHSRALLDRAWKLGDRDAYLCEMEIDLIVGQGQNTPRVEEMVVKSLQIDPTFRGTIFAAANYYLPRWYGAPGDLERFAKQVAEQTREAWGAAVYAQIVWNTRSLHGATVFEDFNFEWELVKQGYYDLAQRSRESTEAMRNLAVLASYYGDRVAARDAYSKLDIAAANAFLGAGTLEHFRRWIAEDFYDGDQTAVYEGAHCPVLQLVWSNDGEKWYMFDANAHYLVWNALQGRRLKRVSTDTFAKTAALDPTTAFIVTTTYNDEVCLHNLQEGSSRVLGKHEHMRAAVMSPDGLQFVTSGDDQKINFWDLTTGKVVSTWDTAPGVVTAADFMPDGKTLVAGTRDKRAVIWSCADQAKQGELAPFPAEASILRISPDGSLVVVLSGKELSVWDMPKRQRLGTLDTPAQRINDLVFSHDGKLVAAATGTNQPVSSGEVLVWDVINRKRLHTFHGHKGAVNAVRFSPDGTTLASCSDDATVRVWKLAGH